MRCLKLMRHSVQYFFFGEFQTQNQQLAEPKSLYIFSVVTKHNNQRDLAKIKCK